MVLSSCLRGGRAQRLLRAAVAVVAAIAAVVSVIGWGNSTAQAAGQTLTVSTATDKQLVVGQPIQITVTAKSDTLMSGTIMIISDSGAPNSYDIEVPAGTTKELTVVGLPLPYFQTGYSVAWMDESGKQVASAGLRSALRGGDTVVGVFPSLGKDFPEKIAQPTDTESHLFTIPEKQLELPSAAFTQYDVIIGTIDDIQRLDGDLLVSFKSWLASGGRLVLDDGDAAAVSKVLGTDQPGDRYGNGEIVLMDGTVRADGWESATRPVRSRSVTNLGPISLGFGGFGFETMTQGLVEYTGNPVIGSVWLFLLVLLYAFLVGPLMFILLRRRRRALWVIGPVIAVAVCSLIWLESGRRRASIQDAHGTVISVSDVASRTVSSEMMYTRSNDAVGIELPPTYRMEPSYDYNPTPLRVVLGADGTTVSEAAEVGSFVVYDGSGPSPQFDGQLTGTVETVDGDIAIGEITNRLDVDLHQVGLLWNGKAKNIGDIAAGETVKFKLDRSHRVREMAPFTLWGESFENPEWGFTGAKPSGQPRPDLPSPALWDNISIADPTIGYSPSVDVVGWTDELASPLTGSPNGISAVMAKLDPALKETEGETYFVYGDEAVNADSWAANTLLRLEAPASTENLAVTLPKLWGEPKLLVGGEWVELKLDAVRSVAIPANALDADGGIYLRSEVNMERLQQGPFIYPRLHQAAPDEKVITLAEATAAAETTPADGSTPDKPVAVPIQEATSETGTTIPSIPPATTIPAASEGG